MSSITTPFRRGYIAEFDGLRALAALCVVLAHSSAPGSVLHGARLGVFGVRFFFALSGFLITGILLETKARVDAGRSGGGGELRTFYIRRALRIFPPYYAFLVFFLLAGNHFVRTTFWWHAAYLTNFHTAFVAPSNVPVAHFWTLAVEEQFYLLWPLLVLWLPRPRLKTMLLIGIVVAVVYRAVAMLHGENAAVIAMLPIGCLDALGLGSLLALHAAEPEPRAAIFARYRMLAWWVGLSGLLVALALEATLSEKSTAANFVSTLRLFCIPLFSTGLLLAFGGEKKSAGAGFLCSAPLSYLGKISYGIYIFHFPFDRMVFPALVQRGWLPDAILPHILFVFAASVATASVSWFLLERPVRNLKRFFPYPA